MIRPTWFRVQFTDPKGVSRSTMVWARTKIEALAGVARLGCSGWLVELVGEAW